MSDDWEKFDRDLKRLFKVILILVILVAILGLVAWAKKLKG